MFDPKEHLINMGKKEYLETKWRLVWFRDEHPKGQVLTDLVSVTPIIMKATVVDKDGGVLATGFGSVPQVANAIWKGREIEKAETAAIGRALGHAGYGTQFTDEDESENLADSPVDRTPATPKNPNGTRPTPPSGPPPQQPPPQNGAHESTPTSEHQPAMLMLGDLIDSPDLAQHIPQIDHRRATVNLLAKNGLFAKCETTPDMLKIVMMYIKERAKGTPQEKPADKAVDALKRSLIQYDDIPA